MPTVTPLPSTPKPARAPAAFSCASPSDLTQPPPQSTPRTSGASASVTAGDPGDRADGAAGRPARTATVTVR